MGYTTDDIDAPRTAIAADVPLFNKNKHVTYWLRCLRTPLPTAYTGNDATRMTLAFFIVSALDILGILFTRTTQEERQQYVDWIYRCQHSSGGFRGFPGTDFDSRSTPENSRWDLANLAATFFALSTLFVLGDDMKRLDRPGLLHLIRSLQRSDGTFGELHATNRELVGGGDTRFAYMATCIRWMLRREPGSEVNKVEDINIDALLDSIENARTPDGGFATDSYRESHAGLTYCATATLSLLGRLSHMGEINNSPSFPPLSASADSLELTVEWLASRLTTTLYEEADDAATDTTEEQEADEGKVESNEKEKSFTKIRSRPAENEDGDAGPDSAALLAERQKPVNWTGFCGRCNKIADTCYAYWNAGSLSILGCLDLVDLEHVECYLLDKTQHAVTGGFSKLPGDLPDIYHAYLGLATFSLINGAKGDSAYIGPDIEDAQDLDDSKPIGTGPSTKKGETDRFVRALDPTLCMTTRARRWIETFEWRHDG